MNRVIIKLNEYGEFDGYVSDAPIELIVYDKDCESEPFYHYQERDVHGVHHVRELLGDTRIAYGGEDILIDTKPSRAGIEVIK